MPSYRIFFLDETSSVLARDDFEADDYKAAKVIAEQIFSACSDVYKSAELWSGATRLSALSSYPRVKEVTPAMQRTIAERARALLQSGWPVARSQRLNTIYREMLNQFDLDGP